MEDAALCTVVIANTMGKNGFRRTKHPQNRICVMNMAVENLHTAALFIQKPSFVTDRYAANARHGQRSQFTEYLFVDGFLQIDIFVPKTQNLPDHEVLARLLRSSRHFAAAFDVQRHRLLAEHMAAFLQSLNCERLVKISRGTDEYDIEIAFRNHVRPIRICFLHAEFACRHGATLFAGIRHRQQFHILMLQQQLPMGTPHITISNQSDFNHDLFLFNS